ncbi:MAG: transporter substrate-binding domain-containing protein [Cyclobacteriaceae bacterium]
MRNPNQKKFCLSILAVWTVLNVSGQLSGSTYQESKQSKKANFVYVYDGIPGFAELKDNQASGLVVDLMRDFEAYLKNKEGIEVSTQFVLKDDFSEFLGDVKTARGAVFGLSNISISEERKKSYTFSPPYLDNVSLLLSNGKVNTLSELGKIADEFAGMVAYSLPSSSYLRRLNEIKSKYYPNLKIVTVPTEAEVLEKLRTDENAFAILDVNYYIDVLKKKENIKRHPVGDLKDDQFGILMPKNSDWEPVLSSFLNSELIGSSRYSQIISDNLGSSALRLLNSFKAN